MKLKYDPADTEKFLAELLTIPGFPQNEETPVYAMIFESGALFRLPEVMQKVGIQPGQPLLVVMDTTPMRRGTESLKPLVLRLLREAGWQPEELVLQPDALGMVHTEMKHIERVKAALRPGMAALSLGSGVVTDVTKHGAFLYEQATGEKIPFVVYQTANSVSAYMSNMAPVLVDGVKRTLPSRYPNALVSDLETLRDAPMDMTVAGVGDMLAVYCSFPDWYLAAELGMDPGYNPYPELLLEGMDDLFIEEAEGIRNGSLQGHALLAKLIALGGFAVSALHTTTPLSGYEHVFSHILDFEAEQAHRTLAQHGSQVALATVIGVELYRYLFENFDPAEVNVDACYPDQAKMHAHVRAAFDQVEPSGKAGEECWKDYKMKLDNWAAHRADFERFLANWNDIRAGLECRYRSPEKLLQIMKAVGCPLTFDQLVPPFSEAEAKYAYLNAPLMRRRLTIGDLLIFLNLDREALWKQSLKLVS